MDFSFYFRILVIVFSIGLTSVAWACPGCTGSMSNPGDKNTVYVLMVFIALTYIPFYFIFKTVITNRNFNKKNNDSN